MSNAKGLKLKSKGRGKNREKKMKKKEIKKKSYGELLKMIFPWHYGSEQP